MGMGTSDLGKMGWESVVIMEIGMRVGIESWEWG
jgi:hypothetical protein